MCAVIDLHPVLGPRIIRDIARLVLTSIGDLSPLRYQEVRRQVGCTQIPAVLLLVV